MSTLPPDTPSIARDERLTLLLYGVSDFEGAAKMLARDLVERFGGVSLSHLKAIVARALEEIECRTPIVSLATVIHPRQDEGRPASCDE